MKGLSLYAATYTESLRGRGLSVGTVKGARVVIADFQRFWGKEELDRLSRDDLLAYFDSMHTREFSPASQEGYAHTILRFIQWVAHRGYLPQDPSEGVKPRKQIRTPGRKIPTKEEMAAILEAVGNEREAALFELMYSSGLRFFEGVGLELTDVNLTDRILLVRNGKGGKDRYVPFAEKAKERLDAYIQRTRPRQRAKCAVQDHDYLFPTFTGKLSRTRVNAAWKEALEKTGLEGKGYTIHCIRHACATHLLEAGAQVRYVQELLGHASLSTTQRYTRPGQERIKAIYRSYHPRENQFYEEVSEEYRCQVELLRAELIENRNAKAAWVRTHGKEVAGKKP